MDKGRLIVIGLLLTLVLAAGCVAGWLAAGQHGRAVQHRDTLWTELTDTVECYVPVAKDSVVVRYVTKVVAVASDSGTVAADTTDTMADSAAVTLPITQKKYETEAYRAYVSGYEPNLDSIFVYQKTINGTVVVPQQHTKQPRLGVGVITGVGYGVINKKPDAFIGAGLYLRW
jgi:hypothetical protein